MSDKNLKSKTIGGFFWRFAERCGAQGVSLIVSIVLARLLAPEQFGVVSLILVFTEILQVFVDSGLGNALIQKKNADDLDFSSVFYFNFVVCLVLYTGMFLIAPIIDNQLYIGKYDNLTAYIRVLSLVLIISGVKNIQQAYVSRKMIFKKFFFATLGGTIVAAIIGIVMAYYGFGVWAIIAQNLVNKVIDTTVLWVTVRWRPKRMFSFERLKSLLSYGWKLLCSSLIDVIYRKVRQLLIGSYYSPADLAFYNEGEKIPNFIVNNINSSIDSVLFPAMSKNQDDRACVKSMTRRSIKTSSFFMWPMMLGICAIAEPMVSLILTDKWLPCVLFMRIFCIVYAFIPIHTANLNAIKAMGRSDIFLKLEIIKKIVGISVMFATIFISIEAVAYSFLATTVLYSFINAFPNKKLLGYSYLEQIKDILPSIILAFVMFACSYSVTFLNLRNIITLILQVIIGVIVYMGGAFIFKMEAFNYILNLIKRIIKRKKI